MRLFSQQNGAVVGLAVFFALATTASAETDYSDCVVVVLDASGSMASPMGDTQQSKMDAAKAALKGVFAQIPENTRLGLLVFSAEGATQDWVYPLGDKPTGQALAAAIDPLIPGGGTPLGKYIKKGADRLLEERDKQFGYGSYRLLVVTDGDASDESVMNQYTPDVLSRGITMDVIGVDMPGEHMLASIAHSYRRADDPASLKRAVSEVFAEVNVGTSATGPADDSFEVTAALEPELALAMLSALSVSGNHPIGTEPPGATPEAPPAAPATPTAGSPPEEGLGAWIYILILAAIGAAILMRMMRRNR